MAGLTPEDGLKTTPDCMFSADPSPHTSLVHGIGLSAEAKRSFCANTEYPIVNNGQSQFPSNGSLDNQQKSFTFGAVVAPSRLGHTE